MQIGSWATCFFSVAMGIHTCSSLVFHLRQINWVSVVVIVFGWIASLVIGKWGYPVADDVVHLIYFGIRSGTSHQK